MFFETKKRVCQNCTILLIHACISVLTKASFAFYHTQILTARQIRNITEEHIFLARVSKNCSDPVARASNLGSGELSSISSSVSALQ